MKTRPVKPSASRRNFLSGLGLLALMGAGVFPMPATPRNRPRRSASPPADRRSDRGHDRGREGGPAEPARRPVPLDAHGGQSAGRHGGPCARHRPDPRRQGRQPVQHGNRRRDRPPHPAGGDGGKPAEDPAAVRGGRDPRPVHHLPRASGRGCGLRHPAGLSHRPRRRGRDGRLRRAPDLRSHGGRGSRPTLGPPMSRAPARTCC